MQNRTLLGDASARQSWKAPDASDKGETYDDHDVIQLWDDFLCSATISHWALWEIVALTDYPSSGWHSAPLTESP